MSLERIFEEYKDLSNNPITNCGITVGLANGDSFKDWKVSMIGPKNTPYEHGIFILNVHFPDNYPNEPPEVCFINPIYHLNINPKAPKEEGDHKLGNVCMSTLNWWNPIYKMREVLLNIYLLFYCHNPDSAYGIDRSKEYKEDDGVVYFYKIRYFTKKYANPHNIYINNDRTQDWDFNI